MIHDFLRTLTARLDNLDKGSGVGSPSADLDLLSPHCWVLCSIQPADCPVSSESRKKPVGATEDTALRCSANGWLNVDGLTRGCRYLKKVWWLPRKQARSMASFSSGQPPPGLSSVPTALAASVFPAL